MTNVHASSSGPLHGDGASAGPAPDAVASVILDLDPPARDGDRLAATGAWAPLALALLVGLLRLPEGLLLGALGVLALQVSVMAGVILWSAEPREPLRDTHLLARRLHQAWRFFLVGGTLFTGAVVGAVASTDLAEAVGRGSLEMEPFLDEYLLTPLQALALLAYVGIGVLITSDLYRVRRNPGWVQIRVPAEWADRTRLVVQSAYGRALARQCHPGAFALVLLGAAMAITSPETLLSTPVAP